MKNVVITGSSRGLGRALAHSFLDRSCRVTVSGSTEESTNRILEELSSYRDQVLAVPCNVREIGELENLWNVSVARWGGVDLWINNAGINQSDLPIAEMTPEEITGIVHTNVIGMMNASAMVSSRMLEQGTGQIFNMEGWGSDGKHRNNLNVYGTTKAALRYFTRGLSEELKGSSVLAGSLSPGIVVTDFILSPMAHQPEKAERQKRLYNILADKPETVAEFLVPRILENRKQGAHIAWLTGSKVFCRFLLTAVRKRDLFSS